MGADYAIITANNRLYPRDGDSIRNGGDLSCLQEVLV